MNRLIVYLYLDFEESVAALLLKFDAVVPNVADDDGQDRGVQRTESVHARISLRLLLAAQLRIMHLNPYLNPYFSFGTIIFPFLPTKN